MQQALVLLDFQSGRFACRHDSTRSSVYGSIHQAQARGQRYKYMLQPILVHNERIFSASLISELPAVLKHDSYQCQWGHPLEALTFLPPSLPPSLPLFCNQVLRAVIRCRAPDTPSQRKASKAPSGPPDVPNEG